MGKTMYRPAFLNENPAEFQSGLNSNFSFETFFSGEDAVAAITARQLSQQPGQGYNPLLLVGGNGLGKTHLLNALGNAALKQNPALRVRYTTSEGFVRDLIHAIREQRMENFRDFYRNLDLWLVDDIDFLAGKEQSSEEFLHTFNELAQNGKRLVVAARRFPREMPSLAESLRSRLVSGVVTRLVAPDLAARLAFLEGRNEVQPVRLAPEVLSLLAEAGPGNFGELEGALNSLVVYAGHSKTPLTREAAAGLLDDLKFHSGEPAAL
jgi:chromosomal replication initiator protein